MKRTPYIAMAALALTLTGVGLVQAAHPWRVSPPSAEQIGLEGANAEVWTELNTEQMDLRLAARNDFDNALVQLDQALADPNSDLRALTQSFEQQVNNYVTQARALRDAKLDLYEQMTPQQQMILRDALRQRLARFKRIRAAFLTLNEYPG